MPRNAALYEQDLYAWTQEQAARLREGAWNELDLVHLIEEVEDVGHSQRDALASHLVILLTHLLKMTLATRACTHDLARAGRGWRATIKTQRLQIAKRLRRNPSLRPLLPEECADAYAIARVEATATMELEEDMAPPACPWTVAQFLDAGFWPEDAAP